MDNLVLSLFINTFHLPKLFMETSYRFYFFISYKKCNINVNKQYYFCIANKCIES